MFLPIFQITNKTLNSLIDIELNKKLVELAPLQLDWEGRLKTEALVKRIFCITSFLDCNLKIDEVAKIVKDEPGRDDRASEVALRSGVVGKEGEIQQIQNLLNVNSLSEQIAFLSNKFKHDDYGIKDLMKINSLLGERLNLKSELGSFRKSDEVEEGLDIPMAVEISFQLEDLFGWFESVSKKDIHPVLRVATIFLELVRIRPFANDNLPTAICFAHLILMSEGYGFKKLWSLEEDMLRNKDGFWMAVSSVARIRGDLSVWFEHFTRWAEEASEKARIKVLNLVGDTPMFKSGGGRVISLTEREIVIMEEMTIRNEMTIKEIRSVLPMVSDDTILRDLKDLIDKKLIRKKGKTKGATYVMGKVKGYR